MRKFLNNALQAIGFFGGNRPQQYADKHNPSYHLIKMLLVAVCLGFLAGCNQPPQHQVDISPPAEPVSSNGANPNAQPKLKEIRPLNENPPEEDVDVSRRGEDPPTLTEIENKSQPDSKNAKAYLIQAGDTYWSIAKKQLGNGHRWKEIKKLNPGVDRTKLKVGQSIRIPKK